MPLKSILMESWYSPINVQFIFKYMLSKIFYKAAPMVERRRVNPEGVVSNPSLVNSLFNPQNNFIKLDGHLTHLL